MKSEAAFISMERYLRMRHRPRRDYVHGTLHRRNVGEYNHGRMKGLLVAHLGEHEASLGVAGCISLPLHTSDTVVRICDVALVRTDVPRASIESTPPLLCVEVLSPKDTFGETMSVLTDYLRMGVPNVWLVDPDKRIAYTCDRTGLSEQQRYLAIAGTGVRLQLKALFARLRS